MIFFQKKDEEDGISDELYHRYFHDGERVWDQGVWNQTSKSMRKKICAKKNISIKYIDKIFDELPDKSKRLVVKYTIENYYDLFKKRREDQCKYCGNDIDEKVTDDIQRITGITSNIGVQAKTKRLAVKILELAKQDYFSDTLPPRLQGGIYKGSENQFAASALYIAIIKNNDELLGRLGLSLPEIEGEDDEPKQHEGFDERFSVVADAIAEAANKQLGYFQHRWGRGFTSKQMHNSRDTFLDGDNVVWIADLGFCWSEDHIFGSAESDEKQYLLKSSTYEILKDRDNKMYGGAWIGDNTWLDSVCEKRECQDRLSGEKLKEKLKKEEERVRERKQKREQEEEQEREAREQERERWERETRERKERKAREREEWERKEIEWQKRFYWSNFRKTDYYIPQELHGNKPSKDRTSDEEFDELVDEYLVTIRGDEVSNDEKKIHERMITTLFISEFTARREAQPDFTNMKDEARKREEAKKSARNQILTEEDLDGTPESILGVSKNASEKQVKAAYRERLKIYHPDKWKKGQKFAHKATVSIKKSFDKIMKKFKGKKDSKKT